MDQWRKFIAGGPRPKIIDNKQLQAQIERLRVERGNPTDDYELGLRDKNNYYILSQGFFKFYYDNFDCNQLIIVKYQKNFDEVEINEDAMGLNSPMMIRRNRDVINKGNELTAIKEHIEDIEVNKEMKDIIAQAANVRRASHLKRPNIEKEIVM